MVVQKRARILTATAVLVAVPLVSAMAQTQPPASTETSPPPSATSPQTSAPPPASTPSTVPSEKKAAVPTAARELAGLTAKSSDGSNLGTVQGVMVEPGGKVRAVLVKVGGFLGFGGHLVAIPDGKFTRTGDIVQIGMTADEVNKLPEVKTQQG